MHSFRKAVLITVAFLISFVIICGIIVVPALLPSSPYNDSDLRKSLSGEIDYLFNGASHSMAAFNTAVVDERLGVCSYNLSYSSAYFPGRYLLVEKEIKRNNIDTVIIEVSLDALSRTSEGENGTGEPLLICRLDTFGEQIKYMCSNIDFFNNEYENVLSVFMRYGLKAWRSIIAGEKVGIAEKNKGYVPEKSKDVSLNDNAVIEQYRKEKHEYPFDENNVLILENMIKLCRDNNVQVYIAVIPISEARIWRDAGNEQFHTDLEKFCDVNECQLLDFNLIKNRFEIFNDKTSFTNETHMSSEGATAFSNVFSDVMLKIDNGEDVKKLFYENYDKMMEDSPYMRIYLSLTKPNS